MIDHRTTIGPLSIICRVVRLHIWSVEFNSCPTPAHVSGSVTTSTPLQVPGGVGFMFPLPRVNHLEPFTRRPTPNYQETRCPTYLEGPLAELY